MSPAGDARQKTSRRLANRMAFLTDWSDPRHGTVNGYNNLRCRCDACKAAWASSHLAYMNRNPLQRQKARDRDREIGRRHRSIQDGAA